jgi:hypothetical protein
MVMVWDNQLHDHLSLQQGIEFIVDLRDLQLDIVNKFCKILRLGL